MSAPDKVVPYVTIPQAVYEARDAGEITAEQFDIFCFGYWKASREKGEYRVYSYSAERVCNFRGLDATRAAVARYQRAAHDLDKRNLIHRDYRRLDPRSNQTERTYSIWLPNPNAFRFVGSAEENAANLWSLSSEHVVTLLKSHNVPLVSSANSGDATTSEQEQSHIVSLPGCSNVSSVCTPNQGSEKVVASEKETPKSPSGTSAPRSAPPTWGENAAAGLKASHGDGATSKNRTLTADQCDQLTRAAILYSAFSDRLCDGNFVPDERHVRELLRHFTPRELLFAQIRKFGMRPTAPKKTMAQFFVESAKTLIKDARDRGVSAALPGPYMQDFTSRLPELLPDWNRIAEAWLAVFPNMRREELSIKAPKEIINPTA